MSKTICTWVCAASTSIRLYEWPIKARLQHSFAIFQNFIFFEYQFFNPSSFDIALTCCQLRRDMCCKFNVQLVSTFGLFDDTVRYKFGLIHKLITGYLYSNCCIISRSRRGYECRRPCETVYEKSFENLNETLYNPPLCGRANLKVFDEIV